MTASTACDPTRKRLIRFVHARARELAIDHDTRRALQVRVTGHASCGDMTVAELERVAGALRRKDKANGTRHAARGDGLPNTAHQGKLWALWLSGWHLGVVDTPTEAALVAFIKRQTGLDAARWARDERHSAKAIEGLKAWLAREAGVDWSPYATADGDGIDNPRARVLEAQWRVLAGLGVVRIGDPGALASYAARHAGTGRAISHTHLEAAQVTALIEHLGGRVRRAKAGQGRGDG